MEQTPTPTTKGAPGWAIPLAIILAGAIVGAAIAMQNRTEKNKIHLGKQQQALESIATITPNDHIRGNPNAKIMMIEYSDSECPFCKVFHPEMKKVIEGPLGTSGTVAWVYRHYPFHQNAPKEAAASECAAELYGKEAFWKYTDALFEAKAPNGLLGEKTLDSVAQGLSYDAKLINECVASGRYSEKITKDHIGGKGAGIDATPTVVYVYNGLIQTIQPGVMSEKTVSSIVDEILKENEGQ